MPMASRTVPKVDRSSATPSSSVSMSVLVSPVKLSSRASVNEGFSRSGIWTVRIPFASKVPDTAAKLLMSPGFAVPESLSIATSTPSKKVPGVPCSSTLANEGSDPVGLG